MSDSKPVRRISASRIKLVNDCSYRFYASEYLKVPEKTWPRTHAGSIVHSVLEALYRDKNRDLHDLVKQEGTIYTSKALTRLVKMWQSRTKVDDKIIADVDPMAMLVLTETNFLDVGAIRRFEPEHEFDLTLSNGGKVKGYIDRMAQFPDKWIITDYKSQKNRFETNEVEDSFQSLMYQLYVWKTFGELAEVRYILLRHPPTKKEPSKHIQITMPATPAQLRGFETYITHMWEVVNRFGPKDAVANFKEDDPGFCRNVCTYYRPTRYLSVKKKGTDELVGNFPLDSSPQVGQDEYVTTCTHKGCPKFNRQ